MRDQVIDADREHGRWEELDIGNGRVARVRAIDTGNGWNALITTVFSGVPEGPKAIGTYDSAWLLQNPPPKRFDVQIDVWDADFGKVLSIGKSNDQDDLTAMVPGPWEAKFGLPERPWLPSAARRIAKRRA